LEEAYVDVCDAYECGEDEVCSDSSDDEPVIEVAALVEEVESPVDNVEELTTEVEMPVIAEAARFGRETIDFSPTLPPLAMSRHILRTRSSLYFRNCERRALTRGTRAENAGRSAEPAGSEP